MSYPKLVRDKIPERIIKSNLTPVMHIADEDEYKEFLYLKLQEEIKEFTKSENEEELADILEVIDAISDLHSFDRQKVKKIKKDKAVERGKFSNRIILEKIRKLDNKGLNKV